MIRFAYSTSYWIKNFIKAWNIATTNNWANLKKPSSCGEKIDTCPCAIETEGCSCDKDIKEIAIDVEMELLHGNGKVDKIPILQATKRIPL